MKSRISIRIRNWYRVRTTDPSYIYRERILMTASQIHIQIVPTDLFFIFFCSVIWYPYLRYLRSLGYPAYGTGTFYLAVLFHPPCYFVVSPKVFPYGTSCSPVKRPALSMYHSLGGEGGKNRINFVFSAI